MPRFLKRIIQAILHVLPAFIFFFISFNLISITETFFLKKAGITPFTFIQVTLAAAVIAKILIVIDHLRFVDLFRNRPLIYGVLWKTLLYWFITLCVRIAIRITPFLMSGQGVQADFQAFINQVDWMLFASIQAWYLMLFFIYVTARELTLVIGPVKMRRIFFGR